ncbi:hypothetical protein ACA910_010668 [Epithemia clementina (nom. ined.)]
MRLMDRQLFRLLTKRCYHKNLESTNRYKAIKRFGAPKSIEAIADGFEDVGNRSVVIRHNGSCRRVALLDPHLTPREFEGLAYRLQVLKRNRSLSAVLIMADDIESYRRPTYEDSFLASEEDPDFDFLNEVSAPPGQTWYVAGGYDPMTLQDNQRGPALHNLTKLALAIRGEGEKTSKIPFLFAPNGAITDGGAAFMLSSYVLVTENTTFSILNPARGLTFDPTGMSWILPRLGKEFQQPSADVSVGCALMLALMGYEANYKDMVCTGLATHALPSPHSITVMENFLRETPGWEQQAIIKEPKRYQGTMAQSMQPEIYQPDYDHNERFRNTQVASLVSAASSFSAEGKDLLLRPRNDWTYDIADPSLDVESSSTVTEFEYYHSDLVSYAFAFKDIFSRETTVPGLLERFKECANSSDPTVDKQIKKVAADFAQRLERQSPMALACTYRLLWLGSRGTETLETCMQREQATQMKLFDGHDFHAWRDAQRKLGHATARPVIGVKWQYDHISEVPLDHVAEILHSQPAAA